MTPNKKNVPAPAATSVEDNEQNLGNTTPARVYLSRWGSNTRDTYGTHSGVDVAQKGHSVLIVPTSVLGVLLDDGAATITLNPDCRAWLDEEVDRRSAEIKRQAVEARRRAIQSRISDQFDDELQELDRQTEKIYARIEELVDAELEKETGR